MNPCVGCGCTDESARRMIPSNGRWKSRCNPCLMERQRELRAAKRDARLHNYHSDPVPDGFEIVGASQYKNGTWIKTRKVSELDHSALEEAVRAICEPYRASKAPEPPPTDCDPDLCVVVPIGDMHVGLRCYLEEVGHEYGLEQAEQNLIAGVDGLLDSAPSAANFLLINVGDYLHADNSKGTTTKGTPLDTEGSRYEALLIALRMLRRVIDRALDKHELVTVINATGNHDGESSVWIRLCLSAVYEAEPRVVIRTEPEKFYYHRHGGCLFGVTHGDTCKIDQLPMIMACDRREDWSSTEHRHWYTGHIHHTTVKEFPGATVETFRTLAPRDKWHHWEGYRSERDLRLDVWHTEHGHIQRLIYGIKRIANRLAENG